MSVNDPSDAPAPSGGTAPAYARAPRRAGLLVALAVAVALAAGLALVLFRFAGSPPSATAGLEGRTDEARDAMAAAKAALDEASRSVLQPHGAPPPPASPDAAGPSRASSDTPRFDASASDAGRPAAPPSDPARTASTAGAGAAKPPAPRPPPATPAASPPTEAVVAAAPPPASAPVQVASADRWVRMKADLAQCVSGGVAGARCERRIRASYCEGYWGSVPECPLSRREPAN